MIGVILAAGDGTRLKNSTGTDCCKALTKVADAYLIEFALNNLVKLGIREVCIVVGRQGAQIRNAIEDSYKGLEVSYVRQEVQKGLIHAFVQALDTVADRDVLLQLADEILVGLDTQAILPSLAGSGPDFFCGVTRESDPEKIKKNYSVQTDETGAIRGCVEKPELVTNDLKGTGFCLFRRKAVALLRERYDDAGNTPGELCDFIHALIDSGQIGYALPVAEKEFNINEASDLQAFLAES